MAEITVKGIAEEEESLAVESLDVTAHQIGHGIFLVVLPILALKLISSNVAADLWFMCQILGIKLDLC